MVNGQSKEPISVLWLFALCALDIAVNASAGPAAVATGAHMNGSILTARALQLGALAGVTKSGILGFISLMSRAGLGTPAWVLLVLLGTSFGICVLVTAEISSLVLNDTPDSLLIAALVAAIPLGGECVGLHTVVMGLATGQGAGTASLSLIGLDALGGYVFARMAHNRGMDICAYKAAAGAGAVYGTVTGIIHFIFGCIGGFSHSESVNGFTTVRNAFGSYSYYDPNWSH